MYLTKESAEHIGNDYKGGKKNKQKKRLYVRTFANRIQIFKEPDLFNPQLKCITHIV